MRNPAKQGLHANRRIMHSKSCSKTCLQGLHEALQLLPLAVRLLAALPPAGSKQQFKVNCNQQAWPARTANRTQAQQSSNAQPTVLHT